jgi:hypothetical protein
MRFQVPQFIEREARIVSSLTFKQFVLLVVAGGLVVLLYIVLIKISLMLFVLASTLIVVLAAALGFLDVNGKSLPSLLGNFLGFFVGPKLYVWRKKQLPPKIVWKKVAPAQANAEVQESNLKIAEKSRLKRILSKIF